MANPSQTINNPTCPSEKLDLAMKLVGDRWTLHIVDVLSHHELRFCEIERALAFSNPATLSNRLKWLEESGVVKRSEETRDKQSVTYELSDLGNGMLQVLDSIKQFTNNYMS